MSFLNDGMESSSTPSPHRRTTHMVRGCPLPILSDIFYKTMEKIFIFLKIGKFIMEMTQQEISQLWVGSVRGGKKNPEVFKKYFRTSHWKTKREEKLRITPYCECCRVRRATQVHHKNYGCWFKEHIDKDLLSICNGCHTAISRRSQNFKKRRSFRKR